MINSDDDYGEEDIVDKSMSMAVLNESTTQHHNESMTQERQKMRRPKTSQGIRKQKPHIDGQ